MLKAQDVTAEQVRDQVERQARAERIYDKVTKDIKVNDADVQAYYDKNKKTLHDARDAQGAPHPGQEQGARRPALRAAQERRLAVRGAGQEALRGPRAPARSEATCCRASRRARRCRSSTRRRSRSRTGVVSQPVKTQFGYHLIEATGPVVAAHARKPLDAALKKEITAQLEKTKKDEAAKEWFEDLKKRLDADTTYAEGFAPPASTPTPTRRRDDTPPPTTASERARPGQAPGDDCSARRRAGTGRARARPGRGARRARAAPRRPARGRLSGAGRGAGGAAARVLRRRRAGALRARPRGAGAGAPPRLPERARAHLLARQAAAPRRGGAAGPDGAPAARLPVGPRADGAVDRAAHRRGGLRGRRGGAGGPARAEADRRARRPAVPDVLPGAARARGRRRRPGRRGRRHPREAASGAIPASSARSERRAPAPRAAHWEAIKRDHEGREGIFHDVPGDAAGAARRRARCSGARRPIGFDYRTPRAPTPTCAPRSPSWTPSCAPRRPAQAGTSAARRCATRPATCCSRPSTCCGWRASTPSSRCAPRPPASGRGSRRAEALAAAEGVDFAAARAGAAGRLLSAAKQPSAGPRSER